MRLFQITRFLRFLLWHYPAVYLIIVTICTVSIWQLSNYQIQIPQTTSTYNKGTITTKQLPLTDTKSTYNKGVTSMTKPPLKVNIHVATTTTQRNVSPSPKKLPVILFQTPWFNEDWKLIKVSTSGRLKCGNLECELTKNRSHHQISDALVFHGGSIFITNHNYFPIGNRPQNQLWIYYNLENPVKTASQLNASVLPFNKDIFNVIMAYTKDADVNLCFKNIKKGNFSNRFDRNKNYAINKTKMVAWVSSGCNDDRTSFVKRLQKFLPIDIYGSCGNLRCERTNNCWEDLGRVYKFYLSFESHICRDYVTDDFYSNALEHNMVPVVIGGANYDDPTVAPPGSYINAQSFAAIQELTDYLEYVASNDSLYNSYFEWKTSYEVDHHFCDESKRFCDLCEKLYDDNWVVTKVRTPISDITDLWGNNRSNCIGYQDIFERMDTNSSTLPVSN